MRDRLLLLVSVPEALTVLDRVVEPVRLVEELGVFEDLKDAVIVGVFVFTAECVGVTV